MSARMKSKSRLENISQGVSECLIFADENSTNEGATQTDEILVQSAVNETGFGKFNYKILIVCCIIFMNIGLSILSLSFVLSAAACDFKMTTEQKGTLTAAPMFGMLAGSYFWGCFADMKGRRITLMIALFLHGSSEFVASFMPYFWEFVALKFVSGLAMCGQVTIVFTYLAEFQPVKYRQSFLSWLEMAWTVAILLSSFIAWAIIPLSIKYKSNAFSFHSWNMFVIICSLPALIVGTWFIFLPETPKYLAETGQNAKMFDVLAKMYSNNTGKSSSDYFKLLMNCENASLRSIAQRVISNKDEKEEIKTRPLSLIFHKFVVHTMDLLKNPYLKRTLLMCLLTYCVMSSYYMLILWFPLLFQRYAEFQEKFPNTSATVCSVMLERSNETLVENDPYDCEEEIQSSVYLYTVILGLSCIPVSLSLPLLINRLGYIFFLVSSAVLAGTIALCIFLVKTSVQILVVSCIFEALTSVTNTVVSCIIVDLYPTHLRSIAAGLAATFSRLGAISGNLLTGSLIDSQCTLVIILVAVQLFVAAILGCLVPYSKSQGEEKKKEINSKKVEEETRA